MEEKLLLKFISGKTDMEEQAKVIAWIEESDSNKKDFARLKNLSAAIDIAAEEKKAEMLRNKRIKTIFYKCLKTAAIIVILISVFYIGKNKETKKWEKTSAEQFTEITAPYGETVSLTLPDGSKVTLNSGSTIKFSKLYGYKERNVSLTGEGYFQVEKSDKEFKVRTPIENPVLKVKVLGTTFNVCSFPEDETITATLYNGSVKICNTQIDKSAMLEPNMKYTYDKKTKKSSVTSLTKIRKWTDNYIIVDRDDITEFAKKIERKYNVEIIISKDLIGKCLYTGAFKGESLKEILDNMALASPISYSIQKNNQVYIKPQTKN